MVLAHGLFLPFSTCFKNNHGNRASLKEGAKSLPIALSIVNQELHETVVYDATGRKNVISTCDARGRNNPILMNDLYLSMELEKPFSLL